MTYKVIDLFDRLPASEFQSLGEAEAVQAAMHGEHGFGNKGLPRFAVMFRNVRGRGWVFRLQAAADVDQAAFAAMKARAGIS